MPGKIQNRICTARFGKVEDNVVTKFFVRLLVDLLQCVRLVHQVQHNPGDLKYISIAVLLINQPGLFRCCEVRPVLGMELDHFLHSPVGKPDGEGPAKWGC